MRLTRRIGMLCRLGLYGVPVGIKSQNWAPYSKLAIHGDGAQWVLSEIATELSNVCARLGINVVDETISRISKRQCVFHTSKYFLSPWKEKRDHRIAFSYFHGNPNIDAEFGPLIKSISQNHELISRVQVSNREMQNVILETGVSKEKVFRIPISIDLEGFPLADSHTRAIARKQLQLPTDAVVIGSFQKDGIGMRAGDKPKLIKGPDILLSVLEKLRQEIPELYVLLTGPARGFVKSGLEKLMIPYRHVRLADYVEISKCFQSLDLYLIASRDEGGPRGVLEAMATGIPLVSTRVGQAVDLVEHEKNGWLADVGDVESLAHWARHVVEARGSFKDVVANGRITAEQNCYESQLPLWRDFMTGFVHF